MGPLLFLASDLSGNAVYPPWQFCQAVREGGGSAVLAGVRSGPLWPPLADALADAVEIPGRWGGLPRAAAAVRLAAEQRAEAVIPFKAMPTSLGVALRVRAARGIPLVVHLDDWDAGFFAEVGWVRRSWWGLRALTRPDGDLWLRAMEARVATADAVMVSTRALQRRFGGSVVRQGVDTNRFSPQAFPRAEARARLGVAEGEGMILFLGTPRAHKGLHRLAALRDLPGRLWFVGAPPEALREAGVPEKVLAGARVQGPVPLGEAGWYLAACDVFVVPQSSTPFAEHQLPAKLVQAMAMGCAVVTTDVADARELLGGDPAAGVVVPPDDGDALGEGIRGLLENPDRAAALGREARRRAEAELGWEAMRRGVEQALEEARGHG